MRSLLITACAVALLTGCAPSIEFTTSAYTSYAPVAPTPPTTPAPATPTGAAASRTGSTPSRATPSRATPTRAAPTRTSSSRATAPVAPVGSFVLGDSIALGVGPRLARLGYPVLGRVGQSASADFLRTNLSDAPAQQAPAWVIVLGTNNAGDESDLVRLADAIEVVGTLRNPSNPQEVYWVTPYRDPRYTGELSGTDLGAFNAALAEAAARLDWLHVVDFAGAAAFHPQWFDADGSHLHPDEVGNAVLAALVAGPDAVPLLTPEPVSSSS